MQRIREERRKRVVPGEQKKQGVGRCGWVVSEILGQGREERSCPELIGE
jgi:hypothetical protein